MKKIKGMTSTGFSFEIDEEARDDMELLERLVDMSKGDLTALPDVLISLLGEKQKKALYDHCRGKSGRVSSKAVYAEIESIFDNTKAGESDTKNS